MNRGFVLAVAALGLLQLLVPGTSARAEAEFPLRVSEDRRHLTDASGRPFLVVGDTAWSLLAQLKASDQRDYLDDRRQRGFNAIIVSLIEHKFADRAPATIDGVEPFLKRGDFARPNPAYFDAARRTVAEAHRRGISVWLCPAYLGWGGNDEGFWREVNAAGPQALRAYGKYVGERFRDLPNIVWMPGGDFAVPENLRWAGHELALGIRDGGAAQLMTAHGGQTGAVETFGDQPWLAVDNVYRYDLDLWRPLRAANDRQTRPFVLIETAYEGEHHATPARIRRQAWWSMTCGACGQFFGNNPLWYFDGPGYPGRSASTWRHALDLAGSRDMTRLAKLLTAQPWQRLVPDLDDRLITAGGGSGESKVTAAHTPNFDRAIVYIASDGTKPRTLTGDLSRFPGPVSAQWHNPARDAVPLVVPEKLPPKPQQTLRTPGDNGMQANDWVLILEARA